MGGRARIAVRALARLSLVQRCCTDWWERFIPGLNSLSLWQLHRPLRFCPAEREPLQRGLRMAFACAGAVLQPTQEGQFSYQSSRYSGHFLDELSDASWLHHRRRSRMMERRTGLAPGC